MAFISNIIVLFIVAYVTALPKTEHRNENNNFDLSSYFSNQKLQEFLKQNSNYPNNFANTAKPANIEAQADELQKEGSSTSNPVDYNSYMKECVGEMPTAFPALREGSSNPLENYNQYTNYDAYLNQLKEQQTRLERCRKAFESSAQQYQQQYGQSLPGSSSGSAVI